VNATTFSGPVKTLDLGRMPACMPLDAQRTAQVAHEAARLGYDLAKLEIGGQVIFVAARLKTGPKRETLALIRLKGLRADPALPIRPEIQHIASNS
jgi:hypothetical protein